MMQSLECMWKGEAGELKISYALVIHYGTDVTSSLLGIWGPRHDPVIKNCLSGVLGTTPLSKTAHE